MMRKQSNVKQKKSFESLGAYHSQNYGNAASLVDKRPQVITQLKLVEAMKIPEVPVQKRSNNIGLPDNLKSGIENLSGHSMDDVKVHYNSSQPAQLNAHAYAQGTTIHVAPGQEKHLAHEAWHVVQQKEGRVKPTLQMKGKVNINDDQGLEKEADVMGAKALQQVGSTKKPNSQVRQLKTDSPIQLNKNKFRNRQTKQSGKNQVRFQKQQQKKQNTPAPKKTTRGVQREQERTQRTNAKSSRPVNLNLKWYHKFLILLYLSSFLPFAGASPLPGGAGGRTRKNNTYDDGIDSFFGHDPGSGMSYGFSGSHTNTTSGHSGITTHGFNQTSGALVTVPGHSLIHHNATDQIHAPRFFAEVPRPNDLHVKSVELGHTEPIGEEEVGASRGLNTSSVSFSDGRKWGRTYLKDARTNANTDNSTVRASIYNSRFLRAMGVTVPEIEAVKNQTGSEIYIASKDAGVYKNFKKLTGDLSRHHDFTPEQRADYVKLALLSPVADLHKKNFGLINGVGLGTIDLDTALPMHSHNYRRLIDRFDQAPEGIWTNDATGSFLGMGKVQDNVFHHQIEIKEADVVSAVKSFCAIPVQELADQLQDYPLQGKASQKLALHSLRTQQIMFREAFKDFKYKPSLETKWVNSTGYELLKTAIEKFEKEHRYPYSFKVLDRDHLEIKVNDNFVRRKGMGFWNDTEHPVTNPQLMKAAEAGHLGDVNLRLSSKTNIVPADIPKLIMSARHYLRSIGAGNPGVGFVVKLVHHPSFDKMDSSTKAEVKKIFKDVATSAEEGNPFRQALFPKGESRGTFKVDSFYASDSKELKDAVDKIKRL